jgi:hypothetical protein
MKLGRENCSDFKHLDVLIHCYGSIGTLDRRRMCNLGTNPKHCKVSNIAGRNMETEKGKAVLKVLSLSGRDCRLKFSKA